VSVLVDIPQPVEDEANIVVPSSLLRSATGVLPRSSADRLSGSPNAYGCPERIVRNRAPRRSPSGAASSVCSDGVRLDLELVAERAFDSELIYGRYRTR
jgi:hypothetical protein